MLKLTWWTPRRLEERTDHMFQTPSDLGVVRPIDCKSCLGEALACLNVDLGVPWSSEDWPSQHSLMALWVC